MWCGPNRGWHYSEAIDDTLHACSDTFWKEYSFESFGLAFEAGHGLMFDENLVWLMDVEFYHRIACQFSDPAILKDTLVLNREHESQVSNNLSLKVKDELRYVRNKFLSSETLSDFYEYCRQSLKLFRKGLF